jgi:NAD-dependent DNA ligase adenylation domain
VNEEIMAKIKQRRRQILVHSFLYYQLNENIISDHQFDKFCNELVDLQKQYPKEAEAVDHAEEFKDFDGSSGYDLPYSLPDIQNAGYHILETHRRLNK